MIGRPRRDATEVIEAYQALEARLEPFTGEFDKPVARIGESLAEHQQRDADVAETVDELADLTQKRTAKLLTAATRAARRHWRRAGGDEAALAEALDSLAERFGPVDKVALTAEAVLHLAVRVVLARWVIGSSRPQPADGAAAADEPVYCETPFRFAGWGLGAIVDKKAGELAQTSFMADLQKSDGPDPTWNRRAHAVWRWSLAIGQRRRALEEACRPLHQAAEQREEARRRAAREAQREAQRRQEEARQRQREADAQQQIAQAEAVDDRVVAFDSCAREFRQSWRPSSREERRLGLSELRHQLQTGRDAVRDERGEVVVPSVPGVSKEQAQQIAGVVAFVLQCNDAATAAARARERLARETELATEHARLREAAAHLPVDDATQQMLAEFQAELHRACEWLSAHWDGIASLLRARGDEAAERLEVALDQTALSSRPSLPAFADRRGAHAQSAVQARPHPRRRQRRQEGPRRQACGPPRRRQGHRQGARQALPLRTGSGRPPRSSRFGRPRRESAGHCAWASMRCSPVEMAGSPRGVERCHSPAP